jgi:type IV secretory pathway VirB2 component (pilin)
MSRNRSRPWTRRTRLLGALLAFSLVAVPELLAVGAGDAMPWNTPLQAILNNVTGPTAQLIIGFGTVGAGLYWIFAGHEGGSKWLGRVVIGGVLILFAQTIISWASFGGAVL